MIQYNWFIINEKFVNRATFAQTGVLILKRLFLRLLFLPVIIILSILFCRADSTIQCLNKMTDPISVVVSLPVEVKTSGKFVKFKGCNKVLFDKSLVDLNTAEASQLELLPGVGKNRAEAIVLQRERMGGFYSVDDVLCTPGIGLKTLAKFKDKVTVSEQ